MQIRLKYVVGYSGNKANNSADVVQTEKILEVTEIITPWSDKIPYITMNSLNCFYKKLHLQ